MESCEVLFWSISNCKPRLKLFVQGSQCVTSPCGAVPEEATLPLVASSAGTPADPPIGEAWAPSAKTVEDGGKCAERAANTHEDWLLAGDAITSCGPRRTADTFLAISMAREGLQCRLDTTAQSEVVASCLESSFLEKLSFGQAPLADATTAALAVVAPAVAAGHLCTTAGCTVEAGADGSVEGAEEAAAESGVPEYMSILVCIRLPAVGWRPPPPSVAPCGICCSSESGNCCSSGDAPKIAQ